MNSARLPASAVLDLNLFVSGLISSLGQPRRLLDGLWGDEFVVVICTQLRDELEKVLQREKFTARFGVTPKARSDLLFVIDAKARFVIPAASVPVLVRDPKDEIVLATALGGRADYLVTGDVDLLVLKNAPAIDPLQIVTVREFLAVLDAHAEDSASEACG